MNWQEAVVKSVTDKAVRITTDGRRIIRHRSGTAMIELHNKSGFRMAEGDEIEGYLDWEPAKPERNPI